MNARLDEEGERPSAASETRAWISVAVVLFAQLTGSIWWAATLNSEVKNLRELLVEVKKVSEASYKSDDAKRDNDMVSNRLNDHESRIRILELAVRKP